MNNKETELAGTRNIAPPEISPSREPHAADRLEAALADDARRGASIQQRVMEVLRKEMPPAETATPSAHPKERRCPAPEHEADMRGSQAPATRTELPTQVIPARMLNEFVYCPRLFYYEFVEGVFVESADTKRGAALHQRVDSGKGDLPPAARKKAKDKNQKSDEGGQQTEGGSNATDQTTTPQPSPQGGEGGAIEETIHSRSVQMGSDRLGVTAKMDLVEVRAEAVEARPGEVPDVFAALEVCPVDYKAGAPREGDGGNELWDTDRMQLGLQALILRDNGYSCREGIIYYRATKQRVRLAITAELETWILRKIEEARNAAAGTIPPPLVASPKCTRCSLAPVCLPDETRMLADPHPQPLSHPMGEGGSKPENGPPRRLMAARDDSRALYLNTPGLRIGRKDEVLVVKEEDRVQDEVRLRDVAHVALFGNIQISTQAVQSLCELEVPLTYFSMGGWFYGITRGHELKNVFLRMEQFRLARDPGTCLRLARQFVNGKIRNHRTMLMRNHVEPPETVVGKLKRAAEDALEAESLEQLLGIEGAAASLYFSEFNGLVKVEDEATAECEDAALEKAPSGPSARQLRFNFNFTHRNRRPPTDPINAMLSLAYSMLVKDCTLAALAVGFDPYVGFYHQPRFGRPALGLDLMEEFRPLVAESTVLNCLNNRVITEKDFVRAGQAVNLSAAGRKRFFQIYEQRMSTLLTHPLFDYKVSYRRALELQARILARSLTGEIPEYVPLTMR